MLTSPAFVAAVMTLLVNDFVMKHLFPGVVTGKLSDFAGIFAFAVFWSAWLPAHRLAVHVATGAGFAIWKSPLVQPLIDGWNSFAPIHIGRVVDASDLIALAMLPIAYWYSHREWPDRSRQWRVVAIGLASFAFVATSRVPVYVTYDLTWTYAGTMQSFDEAVRARGLDGRLFPPFEAGSPDRYGLELSENFCASANIELTEVGTETRVRLTDVRNSCGKRRDDRERFLAQFEQAVVIPLQLKPVQ